MPSPGAEQNPYRWAIVGASALLVALSYGAASAFSVFLKPLVDHFGWHRGAASLAYSANMLSSGVFAIGMGALADRYGTRRVALVGVFGLGLGLILSGRITHLWQLYLTFGLLAGGVGFGSLNAPLVANVTGWFEHNRGLATSITFSGTGLGIMMFSPLSRYLITASGWRNSFLILGGLCWAVGFPLTLLVRSQFTAQRASPKPVRRAESRPARLPPVLSRADSLPRDLRLVLWRLRGAILCCCICMSIPLVHVVAYAQDLGIPKMAAASILAVIGATGFGARIAMGFVSDRIGGRATLLLCSVLQTSGVVGLLLSRNLVPLYLAAALFGVGYGGILPQYAIITRDVMGSRAIARIFGTISMFGTGGMAIGGALGGYLFDLSGTYLIPFGLAAAAGIANGVQALALLRLKMETSPAPANPVKGLSLP